MPGDRPADSVSPPTSEAEKPVSEIRDLLLPWEKKWKETSKVLRSFRSTRNKILAGASLYDLTPAEISAQGLQTPLKFNVYQTVLVAFPGAAILQVWNFVYPRYNDYDEYLYDYEYSTIYDMHFAFFARLINPVIVPILLIVFATSTAWASLRRKDSTAITRSRARRAFHYLSAAHHLFPAMVLSTGVAIIPIFVDGRVPSQAKWTIGISMSLIGVVALARAFWLNAVRLPEELFRINGYGIEAVRVTEFSWDYINPPPKFKFRITAVLMALFGSSIVLWFFSTLIAVLAYGTSAFQAWIANR